MNLFVIIPCFTCQWTYNWSGSNCYEERSIYNLANSISHSALRFSEQQNSFWLMDGPQHPACLTFSDDNKRKKCSFVVQPAEPFSGCEILQKLGALWFPHSYSVHGLSCHGPRYSEHCHSLHHPRLPHSQRMTLQTAEVSHKYSSLEHETQQ